MMILLLAFAAGNAVAKPAEDPLITLEKRSWVAWQAQDADFWQHYLSDDHVEMGYDGPATKAAVVDLIRAKVCKVASYQLDHFAVRYFAKDSAMVTYHSFQNTTCGQAKVPERAWATSLFARREGRWQNIYYSHVPTVR